MKLKVFTIFLALALIALNAAALLFGAGALRVIKENASVFRVAIILWVVCMLIVAGSILRHAWDGMHWGFVSLALSFLAGMFYAFILYVTSTTLRRFIAENPISSVLLALPYAVLDLAAMGRCVTYLPEKKWKSDKITAMLKCAFGRHAWDGCVCSVCEEKRDEGHVWDGCLCTRCGKREHAFEIISKETERGGGCVYSPDQECTGPGCGTWCDGYYPGREGHSVVQKKCKYCGLIETEKY